LRGKCQRRGRGRDGSGLRRKTLRRGRGWRWAAWRRDRDSCWCRAALMQKITSQLPNVSGTKKASNHYKRCNGFESLL
jgi:hypothetical protein